MNAPSWRERCMTDSRLTRGAVSSSLRMFFFSTTRMLRSSRSYSASSAASRLAALWVPLASSPVGRMAVYVKDGTSGSRHVDRAHDLGHGGDAAPHEAGGFLEQGSHSLGAGD